MQKLITIDQLVNLNGSQKPRWHVEHSPAAMDAALRQANLARPKEITDFVDAMTRMFGRIGMHGVCRLCFKGVLPPMGREPGLGCCGYCPLLLEDRCANKPVGCARFMCGFTATLFPRTWDFLRKVIDGVFGRSGWLKDFKKGTYPYYGGCYGGSVEEESQIQLTEVQKRRLRWGVRKLDAWSEREAA
jgi:hypothetical protein